MNSAQLLRNTLSPKAFWKINKCLARRLGHAETILLSELIYQEELAEQRGELTEDGFFTVTMELLEEYTAIPIRSQKRYIPKLEKAHCIETTLRGIPRQKFYKISHEYIEAVLKSPEISQSLHKGQNGTYSEAKMASTAGPKWPDKRGQNELSIPYSKKKEEKKEEKGKKVSSQTSSDGFWKKVLDRLQHRINEPSFNTWLRPMKCVGLTDTTCTISLPDETFVYWVQTNYTSVLQEEIQAVTGKTVELIFTTNGR